MARVKSIIDQFALNDRSGLITATHEPHPIFTELEELHTSQPGSGELEWKERARWVKFEEDVEVDANRWSKPHVGALKLAAAIELRLRINEGVMCFDMKADNLEQIAGNLKTNHFLPVQKCQLVIFRLFPQIWH